MRLPKVEHGHTLGQKVMLRLIRVLSGAEAPDVVKTLWYRKAWFGGPHSALTHQLMRGPSEWSIGERELFAAFCSRLQQCPF